MSTEITRAELVRELKKLHSHLLTLLIERIEGGEASCQELKLAWEILKENDVPTIHLTDEVKEDIKDTAQSPVETFPFPTGTE